MADDKQGRDKQADDTEKRQQELAMEESRERAGEPEPVHDDPSGRLGDLDTVLETHDYPATTEELITAYGDHEVETQGGWKSVDEVL